ncbi:MAG: hypothetical protein ACPG47_02370 [Leucothrix sp.]
MTKKWIIILALALSTSLMPLAQAATNPHQVVARVNNHVLKQYQVNQLLQLANFLSASRIKPQHQNLLRKWAVEDFRNAPASTSVFYQEVARDFLPRIQQLKRNRKALETYRASLYQKIYHVFQSDPAMKRWNYDLMDVVGWYKPPQGKSRQVNSGQQQRRAQQAQKKRRQQQARQLQNNQRRQQQNKQVQQQRRIVRKQQPVRSQSQAKLNAAASQMQQSLAAMLALQKSQAIYRARSSALSFQGAMTQRSTNLLRIQACQLAGNCRYRYDYFGH